MKRQRVVDGVLRSLEEAILSGRMKPGERLIVTQIAEEFGVSQSTVREAFLMLEQRGLVMSKPRRGTFVTRLSEDEAHELCQARALLEAFAITLCGGQIPPESLAQMADCIDAMRECQVPRDLPRLIELDLAFHQQIIAQSQSNQLIEMWSRLNGQIGALIMRGLEAHELNIDGVVALHMELLDALRSGNPLIAQRTVVHHYLDEEMQRQGRAELIQQTSSAVAIASLQ